VLRVASGEAAVELASRGEADAALVPEAVPVEKFLAAEHGTEAGVIAVGGERLRVLAVSPKQHPKVDKEGADLARSLVSSPR
jgi:hypothetical protein